MKFSSVALNQRSPAPSIPDTEARELYNIYQRLLEAFGPQHWWPAETPLEIIIGAVLTQNTAWTNVEKAIANLKKAHLLNLNRLNTVSTKTLKRLIRPAGYYRVKTKRLRAVINFIVTKGGIAKLKKVSTPTLRNELLQCYGIGPETADSILLYAFHRPVFVIDTYTRRILTRYGLINGNEHYEELRKWIETNLLSLSSSNPHPIICLYNEFHALLVRLAKTHCRVKPLCNSCPLDSG